VCVAGAVDGLEVVQTGVEGAESTARARRVRWRVVWHCALHSRARGGGATWEEAGRAGGGGGAARFGRPSKEVPVGRGGGAGAPRVEGAGL
jgi:hypothetical protein